MQKLLQGLRHHQAKIFRPQHKLSARLSQGQPPDVFFIGGYDSRISTHLLKYISTINLTFKRRSGFA